MGDVAAESKWRGCFIGRHGAGGTLGGRTPPEVRPTLPWLGRCYRVKGGLFGYGGKGDGEEEAKDGQGAGDEEGQGVQVLIRHIGLVHLCSRTVGGLCRYIISLIARLRALVPALTVKRVGSVN